MEGPNDIVELIIAVDLNPTNPEEPINVSSVDVRDKGEGGEGGEDWRRLVMQLLMGDPASGVQSDSISYDEAVDAVSRVLGGTGEVEEDDAFSKAGKRSQEAEAPSRKGGGIKAALKNALGGVSGEDEDEDEEE